MRKNVREPPYRISAVQAPGRRFDALKIEFIPVQDIKKSRRNARIHSKKQIEQIISSIRRFGWTYPLLIDESGTIIAGHGRLQAAILLGFREIPVIRICGLSETERRALALADNKIAENAGWDRAMLAAELGELAVLLPECDLDLGALGFEAFEIDGLLSDLSDPEADPADDTPSPAEIAVSAAGDIWQLGSHRLGCGDPRDADFFRKLMGREHAAMVFTDPPYNVRIKGVQGRGKIKHREFSLGSGEMSSRQYTAFLATVLALTAKYCTNGAIVFICIDWRHVRELLDAGEGVFGALKNLIVWVKTHGGMGTFYRSQHELIFVFKNGDGPHINNFELGQHGRTRSNIWSYAGVNTFRTGRLDDLGAHPTVKPVAMIVDAMKDCSRRGDVVLDAFAGSGTALLAAEKVGRRAYGLEIDPLYVDGAIRRWQSFTKRDAILAATGQTFNEVEAARCQHAEAPRTPPVRRLK